MNNYMYWTMNIELYDYKEDEISIFIQQVDRFKQCIKIKDNCNEYQKNLDKKF